MLTYRLPVPPSTNNLFATVAGKRRSTADYKAWRTTADAEIMVQNTKQREALKALSVPCAVSIQVPRRRQASDLDNRLKAILDALVRMRVLPDDNDRVVADLRIRVTDSPDCVVEIGPLFT